MALLAEKEAPWELLSEPRLGSTTLMGVEVVLDFPLPYPLTCRVLGHSGAPKERVQKSKAFSNSPHLKIQRGTSDTNKLSLSHP